VIDKIPFQFTTIKSSIIDKNRERRLNASSYSLDSLKAIEKIEKLRNRFSIDKIGNYTDNIFYPNRFKRLYSKNGSLFLSSKDIFNFDLEGKRIKNLSKDYLVKENWILLTRSGSVGRVVLTNKFFNMIGISEHSIRIVPKKGTPIGYLYAYLSSKIGQTFITKNIFGGVVDEIEPDHIAEIPIPMLSKSDIKEVNQKILDAHKLREESQELFFKAKEMIYKELKLPEIEEKYVHYFEDSNEKYDVKSFILNSVNLNLRFDASYNKPVLTLIRKNLKDGKLEGFFNLGKLSSKEVCRCIFTPPRFKRSYLKDENEGIPLLQGSHMPLIKSVDIKLIWKNLRNIKEYMLEKNWVLVTCSGTIGKTAIVRDYWSGWAATNHITRLIPSAKINPGYLVIYLQSNYGKFQLENLGYGGVVDEIGEAGELFNEVLVPLPSENVQNKIGNIALEAYDKKDKANIIENGAIKLLEGKLDSN
jgi:type I restriction enzyme S subunit